MRFYEAYNGWQRGHLTQEEAGRLLGMGERNFRRYLDGCLAIFHGPRKLADFPPVQKKEISKPELPFPV